MLRLIARGLLWLGGWTPVGGTLDFPRAVLIAAPHTSNWDGIWGLVYRVAFRLDIHFFAKDTLFWFPLDWVLKRLGGVPLDRNHPGEAVPRAVAALKNSEIYYFALAPEGTRSRKTHWKSGFYRIAEQAGVPVVLGFLDYGRRRLGTGPAIELTGDMGADMDRIRAFYSDIDGRHPELATPARLPEEDRSGDVPPEHHRSIRSFVRRTGRLTASQERALAELWPLYGIEFSETLLDLDRVFGRRAARVLEIGFGNGDSLAAQADLHRDRDFLGVEVHEPGVGHCLIRLRELGLGNLRLICHDAIEVLGRQIPDRSIDRINLYFPDPWPKKRHHKRRIVQPGFLALCARKLAQGGTLHIATDWAGYAEHIDEVLAATPGFRCVERCEHDGSEPLDRPRTRFEQRGLRHGHRIVDWIFTTGD